MPNHPSIVARPTPTGFEGRYVHNNGHPAARLPLLQSLYADPFAGDLDAMTVFLIDTHPAGWSQLGTHPTADTGFIEWHCRPNTTISDAVNDRGFRCYCHGDRSAAAELWTEDDVDPDLDQWIYVLGPDGIRIHEGTCDGYKQWPLAPWRPTTRRADAA